MSKKVCHCKQKKGDFICLVSKEMLEGQKEKYWCPFLRQGETERMPGFKLIKDYYTIYSLFTKEKGKVNLNSNKTNLDKASPKKGCHLLLSRVDGGEGE